MEHHLPVFRMVGGLVEQSMIRSECVSSDRALHREAVVESCWESPCRLAALMNLENTTNRHLTANRDSYKHKYKEINDRQAVLLL